MARATTTETGREGEDIAVRYLEEKQWTVIDRNYRFMKAEADIVAYDGKQIIVVEVKTRRGAGFGEPEEAVTEQKKKQLYKATQAWLYERKMEGAPVRFDVIAVILSKNEDPVIRHHEGAFWYL
ncbi:MAG: YraN family protein [Balneolaceae bacterium]|nr:MAG: YraN family protein [Balneolaceae bacterium]